jgi:hypothetical protein
MKNMKKMYLKICFVLLSVCSQSVFAFKLNIKNDSYVIVKIRVFTKNSDNRKCFFINPGKKISTYEFFKKDLVKLIVSPERSDLERKMIHALGDKVEDSDYCFVEKFPTNEFEYSFVVKEVSFITKPIVSVSKEKLLLCRYDENLTREEWQEKYQGLKVPNEEIRWRSQPADESYEVVIQTVLTFG